MDPNNTVGTRALIAFGMAVVALGIAYLVISFDVRETDPSSIEENVVN